VVHDDVLPVDPGSVTATVRNGIVILTGDLEAPEDRELIPAAIRPIWDLDGVIDVSSRLGEQADDASELIPSPAAGSG
jgi:osmotically-inducible protein OsmY